MPSVVWPALGAPGRPFEVGTGGFRENQQPIRIVREEKGTDFSKPQMQSEGNQQHLNIECLKAQLMYEMYR